MSLIAASFDERLARRILYGEGREVEAALNFFERHEPATLEEAAELLESYGPVTSRAFEHIAEGWSIHRHMRGMPGD